MNLLNQYIIRIFFIFIAFILFPKYALASGMEGIGILLILGPLFIICVNFGKYLYLKSNKELKLSFVAFVGVVITELFLIYFSYYPIMIILVLLKLNGIETYKILESYEVLGLFAQALSYGVLAILPNLFLLREKDQTFIRVLKSPNKVFLAAILAFIIPTIGVILRYISIT